MKITAPENLLAATLIGTLLFTITTARAEEGGTGHYAPGSFASFVDVLPGDPSVGVFNYFLYYDGSANVSRLRRR